MSTGSLHLSANERLRFSLVDKAHHTTWRADASGGQVVWLSGGKTNTATLAGFGAWQVTGGPQLALTARERGQRKG